MVLKVQGIRAARLAAEIMTRHTGIETEPHRAEDTGGTYWISNTALPPEGEQEVLDRIPAGTLLRCSGCSHQLGSSGVSAPSPGNRLSPHLKQRLRELAREFSLASNSVKHSAN